VETIPIKEKVKKIEARNLFIYSDHLKFEAKIEKRFEEKIQLMLISFQNTKDFEDLTNL
jgi:hypothetical protein